jgi:hypothetical protein
MRTFVNATTYPQQNNKKKNEIEIRISIVRLRVME